MTIVVVDDVTDCMDNDDNDVITLLTFGELFPEKPKTCISGNVYNMSGDVALDIQPLFCV